jgi:hypothetical protein
MRHMKPICIFALSGLALLSLPAVSNAQRWYGMATWNISIPEDDTKKFVDETSYRGFGLEFRKQVKESTTLGIMTSWEVFHERTNESFQLQNATITGSQDHYINSFPIMLGLHRYFGADGGTRPYIGISGGGFVVIQTLRIGLAEIEEDSWEWGVMPEVGFLMPLESGAGLIVNARYSMALTGENLRGDESFLTYWGVRVGLVWDQY